MWRRNLIRLRQIRGFDAALSVVYKAGGANRRKRNALVMTKTLEKAIAPAPNIGESKVPLCDRDPHLVRPLFGSARQRPDL